MATKPDLIYCAAGNKRFAEIAIETGFAYGGQLPGTVYFPPDFVDQKWKRPNFEGYINALATHRPRLATVLDYQSIGQLARVLWWGICVSPFVTEAIIIIPKLQGSIPLLPRHIGGKSVRLGYSVPTAYGGTELPIWDFSGWPVHLLGGSPGKQMNLARYLDVKSCDGNMAQKMAVKHCAFWLPGKRPFSNGWVSLDKADGQRWGDGTSNADAPCEAFRRSCVNIVMAWETADSLIFS